MIQTQIQTQVQTLNLTMPGHYVYGRHAWEQVHGVRVVRLRQTAVRLTDSMPQLHPMIARLPRQSSACWSLAAPQGAAHHVTN